MSALLSFIIWFSPSRRLQPKLLPFDEAGTLQCLPESFASASSRPWRLHLRPSIKKSIHFFIERFRKCAARFCEIWNDSIVSQHPLRHHVIHITSALQNISFEPKLKWGWSCAEVWKSCRSRELLKNAAILAIGGVDTSENEPLKARMCFHSCSFHTHSAPDAARPGRRRGLRPSWAGSEELQHLKRDWAEYNKILRSISISEISHLADVKKKTD